MIKIGGIILAGGRSSRLGVDKALLRIDNTYLIIKQIREMLKVFNKVFVVAKDNYNDIGRIVRESRRIIVIRDVFKVHHPLSGIVTAGLLLHRKYTHIFTVPVDLPNINHKVINFIISSLDKYYDCVIPMWNDGKLEPLIAIYSIDLILKFLKVHRIEFWNEIPVRCLARLSENVKYVSAERLASAFGDVFLNLNRAEMLRQLQ